MQSSSSSSSCLGSMAPGGFASLCSVGPASRGERTDGSTTFSPSPPPFSPPLAGGMSKRGGEREGFLRPGGQHVKLVAEGKGGEKIHRKGEGESAFLLAGHTDCAACAT